MTVQIAQLRAEHHHDGFGISTGSPRLSWRFASTAVKGWRQASYDLVIARGNNKEAYHVDSAENVLVPWPSAALSSRETAYIKVRATGKDGSETGWASLTIEAALLQRSDWIAKLISGPPQPKDEPKSPFRLRKTFGLSKNVGVARLYATAHGLYQVQINGKVVGDEVLAPGWQSYHHRLHFQTYDITHLLKDGLNIIGAEIGEGWFAGRLGRPGVRNIWGDRLGFLAQLEIDGRIVCATDSSWEHLDNVPTLASEIYNGEVVDTTIGTPDWCTASPATETKASAEELPFPSAELIAPDVAPVRRVAELKPKEIITTTSGKKVLDFGQNLVGWLRIEIDIAGTQEEELLIRYAEVMEHDELGTRPLRTAKARDVIKLGGKTKGWEPKFTFHGFR
ncbi:Bacterial alpha-L-rhamnosidase [Macrophomina phaseolina MS6]|uniref:Bacterial alpha-L-rhamnosidase n=1 Tax=Macrophomina phaseolina (strain MS6) TaxID=1126212 RepID=K2QRS5_MACPH|nr:Bacterial alpha-L-rhamnosidase [Macrophomina phaseolina MS6]